MRLSSLWTPNCRATSISSSRRSIRYQAMVSTEKQHVAIGAVFELVLSRKRLVPTNTIKPSTDHPMNEARGLRGIFCQESGSDYRKLFDMRQWIAFHNNLTVDLLFHRNKKIPFLFLKGHLNIRMDIQDHLPIFSWLS